ncbi:MAG: 4Fe-4S binding protein [Clostridia bacterium]|nr:4Fe-4S binding protein [Clostridia bacterium]
MSKIKFLLPLIIFIFFFCIVNIVIYAVGDKCPFEIELDPYPGKCGLYKDGNNDKVCDLSLAAPNNNTVVKTPAPIKVATPTKTESPTSQTTKSSPAHSSATIKQKSPAPAPSSTQAKPNEDKKISSNPSLKTPAAVTSIHTPLQGRVQTSPPIIVEEEELTLPAAIPTGDDVSEVFEDTTAKPMEENAKSILTKYILEFKNPKVFVNLLLIVSGILFFILTLNTRGKFKWLRYACLGVAVIYLGFVAGGCPSPIGSMQQMPLYYSLIQRGKLIDWVLILLIPTITALLVGRIYCGSVCPFGGVQDIFYKAGQKLGFSKKINKKTHTILKYSKYFSLAVLMGGVLIASTAWYCNIDPFSYLFKLRFSLIPLLLLAAVITFSFIYARPFCRYLCPYGAVLSLISIFSPLLRLKTVEKNCRKCTVCEGICPVGAIDKGSVDNKDCIKCGECMGKCPFSIK